ncbi:hypothetical protein ABW19_dt0201180 [Dactylella cylindrospora]|nr:hypothetical protein ABW19_dt0201180 [Dactylella cylindrospora]
MNYDNRQDQIIGGCTKENKSNPYYGPGGPIINLDIPCPKTGVDIIFGDKEEIEWTRLTEGLIKKTRVQFWRDPNVFILVEDSPSSEAGLGEPFNCESRRGGRTGTRASRLDGDVGDAQTTFQELRRIIKAEDRIDDTGSADTEFGHKDGVNHIYLKEEQRNIPSTSSMEYNGLDLLSPQGLKYLVGQPASTGGLRLATGSTVSPFTDLSDIVTNPNEDEWDYDGDAEDEVKIRSAKTRTHTNVCGSLSDHDDNSSSSSYASSFVDPTDRYDSSHYYPLEAKQGGYDSANEGNFTPSDLRMTARQTAPESISPQKRKSASETPIDDIDREHEDGDWVGERCSKAPKLEY